MLRGQRYSIPNSSLLVRVLNVYHETPAYIKAKVQLYYKNCYSEVQKPFTTKLVREVVELWERQ